MDHGMEYGMEHGMEHGLHHDIELPKQHPSVQRFTTAILVKHPVCSSSCINV